MLTVQIRNDTDGDEWDDGPEVYYQDHDDDGMATAGNIYFNFDPYDNADRMVDTDGDGHINYCEYKWDTNPRDINSSQDKASYAMRLRSNQWHQHRRQFL